MNTLGIKSPNFHNINTSFSLAHLELTKLSNMEKLGIYWVMFLTFNGITYSLNLQSEVETVSWCSGLRNSRLCHFTDF